MCLYAYMHIDMNERYITHITDTMALRKNYKLKVY